MRWLPWWVWLSGLAIAGVVIARSSAQVQLAAGMAGAVLVLVGLFVWRRRNHIRDWQDAERATARWLRRAGCRRVMLTGGSADGGIDVLTSEWAVQVKHTAKRVGRPAVQQLVGAALSVDRAPALFSTSGFSGPACEYAAEHQVALFELDIDGSAHGINRPARKVGSRMRRLTRRP